MIALRPRQTQFVQDIDTDPRRRAIVRAMRLKKSRLR